MAGEDFGVNLGAGIVTNLVKEVVGQARYCYGFNKIARNLGNEQDRLRSTRDSILVQVRKAKANTHEPSKDIQQQMREAEDLIEKVEKLKGKAEASKSCCNGVFPNWICRCVFGKQAERKTEEMKQLNENLGQKLLPAHRLSLRPMRTSEDFVLYESREEVLKKLIMALKDDENTRIGLYGMGGCGKSSLLKVVQESVKDLKLFDKMAYAVVSNPPKISAIQQDIADWLGLNFETEISEHIRATRLSMGFAEDKKYLVILDDVWEVLKFDDIGIPFLKNCKVLLSTRLQQICTLMDCQEVIHLSLLTKGEARNLFQRHAGVIEDDIVAQEINDECHRLPVAIKAVASTLKGKSVTAWKQALETLKNRKPLDIEKGLENPYRCLKLSVDYLDDEVRSLFLLCALFPEDSKIALEDLIRFAFGLGIFEDVGDSYERVRSKVGAAIDKIKGCSLLLQAEERQIVEMHDLVRDVALWVANKKTQVIMGPGQNLKAITEMDYWRDTTRLYCHDVNEFPEQLNCPKLEILFVSSDGGCSSEPPDAFFEEMIELKVLVMIDTSIWTNPNLLLPRSIEGLKKLRTLCLRGWALDNISILGKMKMLDTIQLLYCVVKEFPNEFAELRKLKLLEVSGCRIGGSPFEVLARCSHLEELYFVENSLLERVSNDQDVVKLFHQIGQSKVLQRYHVEIGSCIETLKDELATKFTSINNFNASTTNEAIQYLAQKLEVLFLEKIKGDYKSIIPEMIPMGGGMIELTEILVRDVDNIECLIDTTNHQIYQARTVFSKLLKLKIEAMKCLEALCRGPPPSSLFENLKELFIMQCSQLVSIGKVKLFHLKFIELEDCPKLISLFTIATAQTMELLEVLKVTDCDKLKHIIEDEGEDDIISIEPVFPKLKQISIKGCEHLEYIIPALLASGLSQLESFNIEDAPELKHVFGKCNHEVDQNQNRSIDLPVLKVFKLIDLPNVVNICPQNYRVTCPSLDESHIMGCPQWSGMSDLFSEVRQQGGGKATKQWSGEDVGINVRVGMVKHLVQETTRQARCFYRFDTLVTDLNIEKDKLRSTRESILVHESILEPSRDLLQQLEEAKDLIEKVEKLEGKAEATKSSCHGVCPNWLRRYIVGRHLVRMTEAVKQLKERLTSNSFRPIVMDNHSENFILFESRKQAYDELLMALKDKNSNMIGLCGTGGCGKTFLALEMCEAADDLKLFDEVIFVLVRNYPKISVIQDKIAQHFGLIFNSYENGLERAARLSMRLNNGEKFLIVLDDVWQVLKLEDVGIPRGKNCKVIITTRDQQICTMMDCQKVISLSLLTEMEAWILFQTHVGIIEDTFKVFAQEIAKECGRLPLVIIAVAKSLKCKPAVMWEEALKELRDCTLIMDSELENPQKCLKLCINNLGDDEVRSLLLLCALFPENSIIALEILTRFAFGLGIFKDDDSYEKARSKVSAAIDKLEDSCLLLLLKGQLIYMHNLVREVALWVAKQTQVIMGPVENLKALTERDYMKDTTRLYWHDTNEFPDHLNCPKLEILFVSSDGGCSSECLNSFFKEMIELKVLAIKNTSVLRTPNLLPQSIEGLKKLRTLCLRGWVLDNIFILGELEMLNTIELSYCVIKKLPQELAKLRRLKLLEVSGSSIGGNPFEVLATCSQLEELYFVRNNVQEMVLNHQNVVELFNQIGSSKELRRYHLEMGSSMDALKDDLKSKFISLNNFDISTSNEAIKDLAHKLDVLFLEKIQGDCKNIIPGMVTTRGECMSGLIEFLLCDSDNIECLIDTTNRQLYQARTVFSKLQKLKLKTMRRLEALCHGPPPSGLFEKLEELFLLECSQLHCIVSVGKLNLCNLKCLQLEDCPNLTSVFTYSTSLTMVLLEVLKVRDCTALKHIIKDEEEVDHIISAGPVFPKLKLVNFKRCEHLECIIPASFAGGLSQLESLEIEDASELRHVFGKDNHEEYHNLNQSIDLPALKVFKLTHLPNIVSICPQNYHITWLSMDGPHKMGCPQLSSMSDLDSEVRQQDEEEAIAAVEQQNYHDDDAKDEDEREEQQHKEGEYAVTGDSRSAIGQSTTNCVETREVDEVLFGNPSVGNYSLPSTTASGMSKADAIHKDKEVPSHIAVTYTNEGRGFATVTSTIQDDNLDEETKRCNHHIPSGYTASSSSFHFLKQDVQANAEVHPQSQEFDIIVDTQEGLQEQNFYPVGSMNSKKSNTEIAKVCLQDNPAPEESTVGASSQELIENQPQVEHELPQVLTDPQQALQEHKVSLPLPVHPAVLSPSTSISTNPPTTEALASSSAKQRPVAEELADFHGLSRRSLLLEEAFVKYPHLWNWKISQKSPRFCKWGYKSLTEMLAFLKSEKPKAMDDSKRKKFEDLCFELESFGFDEEWLASIRQRVMNMQVDHNDKFKQLVQLKSDVSTLEDQLNVARARIASIEHELSKLDDVFGL